MTRNQRRQAEKSFNITDYIDGFRKACLNRAKDIRDFASGCDSVVLDGDEWKHLKELTHMLTEQLEFLQDAWKTMMRLIKEHEIDIEKDDAYKAIEHSRAHALKVATMAFQIADEFEQSREGRQVGEDDTVTEQKPRQTEEIRFRVEKTTEKNEKESIASGKAPPGMQAESIRSHEQREREKAGEEEGKEADSVGVIVQSSLENEIGEDVNELSENETTHAQDSTTESIGRATAPELQANKASKAGAAYARQENTKRAGTGSAGKEREKKTTYGCEHEEKQTSDATTEHPVEPKQRERGREIAKNEHSEGHRVVSETESHNKRTGANETEKVSADISQPAEAGGSTCAENKYEEIVQQTTMDPGTRIVARIDGERKRTPTASRGWYVNQDHKPWEPDETPITQCKISININDVMYSVACYVRSADEGARTFRCPAPLIIRNLRYDKATHPGDYGDEYEYNSTIWMKPKSGDNVVTAWKHMRQDPYARIKKGIGVCYHCGRKCGRPATCTARNKSCFMCEQLGHTLRACTWRYKTKRVPVHSIPLHPGTRIRLCEELAEHVEEFLELMKDETTTTRPKRLLEHDASTEMAMEWLHEFEEYFETKEVDLLKRGYNAQEHGRMILNAYIDKELENKINRDEPPGAGMDVRGDKGCTGLLRRYFKTQLTNEKEKAAQIRLTPITPIYDDDKWRIIDVAGFHDDWSGKIAAQAREHQHFQRRTGYTYVPAGIDDPRLWNLTTRKRKKREDANNNMEVMVETKRDLTDLPNEILQKICLYLPFRAIQNLRRTARRLRDYVEQAVKIYESISITGEHIDEVWLSKLITTRQVKHFDVSRGELDEVNGTIDQDVWAYGSKMEGICLSGFNEPYVPIAAMVSTLDNLTTLDMSYSRWDMIDEISRALEDTTKLKNVNVGTSPYMRMHHQEHIITLKWTLTRLIRKCPRLENIILHGLDLTHDDFNYVQKQLPPTLEGIDVARNQINDINLLQLMSRCPSLKFLDSSETRVTHNILIDIAAKWGHSLINLALPDTVAKKLREDYKYDKTRVVIFQNIMQNMSALRFLRLGNWRGGTAAESHRTMNGRMSVEYTNERATIKILRSLFPNLEIHFSPFAEEDEHFYDKNGFPRPNPLFPPPADPHYHFRRWGRGGKNFFIEDI